MVQSETCYDGRVIFLETTYNLFVLAQCVTVERLHLVVVDIAIHADMSDMFGILVQEIFGSVLIMVRLSKVGGAV